MKINRKMRNTALIIIAKKNIKNYITLQDNFIEYTNYLNNFRINSAE